MFELDLKSKERLMSCDVKLRLLVQEVAKKYPVVVLEGHRDKVKQDAAFISGVSKTAWPQSKHNYLPSKAVDIAPAPLDWQDTRRFYHLIGFTRAVALYLGIKIRVGADWNGNFEFKDQNFHDLPHIELVD